MATLAQQQDKTSAFEQQLLVIQQAAVRAVSLNLVITLAMLKRQSTGRMLIARDDAQRAAAALRLAEDLQAQALPLLEAPALLGPVLQQAESAIELAARFAEAPSGLLLPLEEEPSRAMESAAASARDRIDTAVNLLKEADSPQKVAAAMGVADQSVGRAAAGAEYAVDSAANSAPRRIAVALGEQLLWVAERDACIVCLALAGHLIDPNEGEAFDEEATFGEPGSAMEVWPRGMPLMGPPRHNHCHCHTEVWRRSLAGQPDYPTALRREALRSVAKGWSKPSESHPARLRAAERILADGRAGQLPVSVQREAAASVARGRFTTRDVPSYRSSRTNVR